MARRTGCRSTHRDNNIFVYRPPFSRVYNSAPRATSGCSSWALPLPGTASRRIPTWCSHLVAVLLSTRKDNCPLLVLKSQSMTPAMSHCQTFEMKIYCAVWIKSKDIQYLKGSVQKQHNRGYAFFGVRARFRHFSLISILPYGWKFLLYLHD